MTTTATEFERRRLVFLLWVYFVLLIGEGALRKWVFPQWSDALLIVRDPVAVAILLFAARAGFLAFGGLLRAFAAIGISLAAIALVQVIAGTVLSLPVLSFGLRTYLLHPPLIFVMGRVLRPLDLRRFSLAIIVVLIPVAVLMAAQFQADPADWINRGAGEGRVQILSTMGHVRPAGPFSFISGPILLCSLAFASLIGTQFGQGRDLMVARAGGWAALVVAGAVSGSRALVAGLAPVGVAVLVASFVRPHVAGRFLRGAITAAFIVTAVWSSSVVQDGLTVFSTRVEEAQAQEDLTARVGDAYRGVGAALVDAPLFGHGVGLGTNAGNALLGADAFRLGEDEWTRIVLEAGPVFGAAYLVWRIWLVVWLLRRALHSAGLGYVLPILCLGACITNLWSGNWGQSTTQGFAVWAAGMTLAACRVPYSRVLDTIRPTPAKVTAIRRPARAAV